MAAGEETPGFVAALRDDPSVSVIAWGGDETSGFVEWTTGAIRTVRIWRTAAGEVAAITRSALEPDIKMANFDIWGAEVKAAHREIEDLVRRSRLVPKRPGKAKHGARLLRLAS